MQHANPTPSRWISLAARLYARLGDTRLAPLGVASGHIPVIACLKHGPLTQAELARMARVEQSSMAQMLTRMERDGLIERTVDPRDRRSRKISLSAETRARIEPAREILGQINEEALAGFSAEEVETLMGLLGRLVQNLDRIGQESPLL